MTKLSKMLKSETPSYTMTLPISKKKITYRPFKVKEEKVLLMAMEEATEEAMLRALLTIIESCCEGIEDAGELMSIEIEHIFIQLRSKSVGEIVEPVITCPHTGELIPSKIDLSDIYISKIVEFFENAPTLSYDFKYKTKDEKEREITLSGMQDFFV